MQEPGPVPLPPPEVGPARPPVPSSRPLAEWERELLEEQAADRHTPRPHPRTATCRVCELPIVYSGEGRWLHEADGSDDFDPSHRAQPAAPPAEPSGAAPAAAGPHPDTPARTADAHEATQPCSDPYCDCCYPYGVNSALRPAPQRNLAPEAGTPTQAAGSLGPGVVGRALLHQTADGNPQLWVERDGMWHTHIASVPRTRGYVESAERYVGPVREVLLMDPAAFQAAGRVLDAAREMAAASSRGLHVDEAWEVREAHRRLAAAVDALDGEDDNPDQAGALERFGIDPAELDALDGDQPAEPPRLTGLTTAEAAAHHRRLVETMRGSGREPTASLAAASRGLATEPAPRRYARADEFPCGAPHPEGGVTCRLLPHDHGTHARPESGGLDAWTEPAPEPDSGPGWDRGNVEAFAAKLSAAPPNDHAPWNPEIGDQLRALLADRDSRARSVGYWSAMARDRAFERNAARELAEVTAGWRRLALAVYPAAHPDWAGTCLCEDKDAHDYGCRQGHGSECDADCDGPCIRPLESLRALTAACTCGTSPMTYEGPEPDCPVHGAVRAHTEAIRELAKLRAELATAASQARSRWQRMIELRQELATARRDAARSTLNYAGTTASSVMERDRLLRLAEDFGSGIRPVPGSPQPASNEGDSDANQ